MVPALSSPTRSLRAHERPNDGRAFGIQNAPLHLRSSTKDKIR